MISNNFEHIFCKGLIILFFYALVLIFTACQPGYFGTNCSFTCSPNCKTCRHTDGLCSCRAGWMGHECSVGKSNRKNDIIVMLAQNNQVANSTSFIKHLTLKNTLYLSECTHSYGENCQYPCSGQCINRTCDRFNGNCFCDGKCGKI